MRDAPYVHARHLDEAVRQKVISSEQREALVALARTMARAEARALPDVEWFQGLLAGAAAAALVIPGGMLLRHLPEMAPHEVLAAGLVGVAAPAALAVLLRGRAAPPAVVGILAAGAASFAWAIGAGLARGALYPHGMDAWATMSPQQLPRWTIPADLTLLAGALALGAWLRAPATALPAALALGHLVLRVSYYVHFTLPSRDGASYLHTALDALPWCLGASAILGLGARLCDRAFRGDRDPAFWLHLVAPAPALVGVADACAMDPPSPAAVALALLWPAVFALAFAWRRASYLVAGLAGLVVFPVTTSVWARQDVSTGLVAALWVPCAVLVFAFVAFAWRQRLVSDWGRDGARDERTVWA